MVLPKGGADVSQFWRRVRWMCWRTWEAEFIGAARMTTVRSARRQAAGWLSSRNRRDISAQAPSKPVRKRCRAAVDPEPLACPTDAEFGLEPIQQSMHAS